MQDQKDSPPGATGSQPGGSDEPTAEKQGQHWKGEPWAKNPKVGGKETPGSETEGGTSGQHWRGEDMPVEKKAAGGRPARTEGQATGPESDRPDEC